MQDEQLGGVNLDWYDYGARMYDPALGRWHVPDAFGEFFESQTPYAYVSNNPINAIDPDGNFETKFGAFMYKVFNGGGKVLQDKGGEYFVLQKGENKGVVDITMNRVFEVQEYGDSENQPSLQEMQETLLAGTEQKDFSGLEGKWDYFSNGGSFDGFDYNLKGEATGVTLTTGTAPTPGFGPGVKVLQTGGRILKPSTLKALKLTKGKGKAAIESMKKANGLRNDFHGKILSNGDVLDDAGNLIDNILDYAN